MSMVKEYLSKDNKINEAVLVGTVLLLPLVGGYFMDIVTIAKFNALCLLVAGCFGIGGAKAIFSK